MKKEITVHYAELSTKGRNRMMFINKLADHIRYKLRHVPGLVVEARHSFTYVSWQEASYEEVTSIIKDIPGIARFEPSYPVEKDLDQIKKKAVELFEGIDNLAGKTFKVKATRSDKEFEYDTYSIQREVGSAVGQANPEMSVDLTNFDYELVVNIHDDAARLSLDSYPGQGGLPYGTSDKGLLMLSGGFDSPIAGYLMMRRGLEIEAVHFSSPPYTSPQALEKAKKLTSRLAHFGAPMKFHNVPFAKIQEEIRDKAPDSESMTLMRRFMLRIMDVLLEKTGAQAIVNGESLGQVASQTLTSMQVINDVTSTPILRPLVAMDKNDIIKIAQEIGTHDISNEPYEDCCTVFAPVRPSTNPKLERILRHEEKFDIDSLVQEAVEATQTVTIDEDYLKEEADSFSHLL